MDKQKQKKALSKADLASKIMLLHLPTGTILLKMKSGLWHQLLHM